MSEVQEEVERGQGQQLHFASPPDPLGPATSATDFLKLNTAGLTNAVFYACAIVYSNKNVVHNVERRVYFSILLPGGPIGSVRN